VFPSLEIPLLAQYTFYQYVFEKNIMGLKKLVVYVNGNYPGKKCYYFLPIVEKASYYLR